MATESDTDVDETSVEVNESLLPDEGASVAEVGVVSVDDATEEVTMVDVVESLLADAVTLLPVWSIARVHVFTSSTAAFPLLLVTGVSTMTHVSVIGPMEL